MPGESATAVLLDYTQDKISVVTADGTITYVNDAAQQILGYDPATLVGENAFDYIHPDDRDAVRELFAGVIAAEGESKVTDTYRHRTADGSWVWLESRMSNLTDDVLDGYVVSSRDITDRVEATKQREETETRLQEIAEQTSEVLWVFNHDFTELLFCNDRCAELYGVSVEQLEDDPTTFLECIHPEDVSEVEDAMRCLTAGEPVDMEYRVNAESDYTNWVWVQAEPLTEDGDVVRIVGFARDITDRRRRERQLAVMDNLLRHNLRNQMNAILTNAELIEDRPTETPGERAAIIRQVGERLIATAEKQRHIIELLDDPNCPRRLDLSDAAAEAVAVVSEEFPDATIETELHAPLPVRALPQLELAIEELIENALDHAKVAKPTATVATRPNGDVAELDVRDHCPPIPEHEYQVLTGEVEMTATYHSSGLGLWLVYWLVDLSDGDIQFSRTEQGNVATVSLPRPTDSA